jgi:pimeloyl-ACP methyl ester carboxylesterase
MIFVPGYHTSRTCTSVGDTYLNIANYVQEHGLEFRYVPMPNNNYGDIGHTTLDSCVEHVVHVYNQICNERDWGTIILAGHSMGGLLVTRMISTSYCRQLMRVPDRVCVINPAYRAVLPVWGVFVATFLSYLPESILGHISLPLPISTKGALYPSSPTMSPVAKPMLLLSMLQATGRLLAHNKTWDLVPDERIHLTILACRGDTLADFVSSRQYAEMYDARFIAISSDFHEYFDDKILTRLDVHD